MPEEKAHPTHTKKETGLIGMLEPYFTKQAPWQMPEEWRKNLVNWIPWINLVIGILFLPLALAAIGLAGFVSVALNTTGYNASPLIMFSGVILLVSVALLIFTFPGMKARKLSTWKIIFWADIIYFAYGIVNAIGYGISGGVIMNIIWSVIGTAIGLYVLFQIKHYYK
ncbi:MAG: hypothetical protein U0526_00535 [Candidatus Saccharibacteria bacterium]|jgi:hypothetical protein